MTEGIIDVLEQVEIDTQHRDALVAGLAMIKRLPEAFLIELPVRQIGQAVMVRHVGDPGLGLVTLGDIDHGDQIAIAAVEHHPPPECQHMNLAAVGLEMPPVTAGMIGIADLLQRLRMGDPFVLGPDLLKLHAQERRAAVSVMLHGGVVDAEKSGGLGVEHPHRHRVVVKQQPE
jgi:hypothetical protein